MKTEKKQVPQFPTRISRLQATDLGRQAVQILDAEGYRVPSGRKVELGEDIANSVQGTVAYPYDFIFDLQGQGSQDTQITVTNETTLSAARRLLKKDLRPAALNFASATSPGGGFLNGARAQEEYLARSSGLYACLRDQEMYDYHRQQNDPLYTSFLLYSPDVPVFRDDWGGLLETPYLLSIITAAAPNAKYIEAERQAEIAAALWERILKILWVGRRNGHDALILGAWGCGAFGNDGKLVSSLFHKALNENFKGAYKAVVFAIVDWSSNEKYIGPFRRTFSSE